MAAPTIRGEPDGAHHERPDGPLLRCCRGDAMEAEAHEEHRERQRHVDETAPRDPEELEGGQEHERRDQGRTRSQEVARHAIGQENREQPRKRRHEARGGFAGTAEEPVGGDHAPVEERRLLQERLAVEVRNDVIPRDEHLARHLRLARLVRIEQIGPAEPRGQQHGRRGGENPGLAPGPHGTGLASRRRRMRIPNSSPSSGSAPKRATVS
jgi:hypothetical protein